MDSWKPIRYGTCFLGWENERCFYGDISLEINMSLWDQPAFPWILIRYIRGCSDENEVNPCGRRIAKEKRTTSSQGILWEGVILLSSPHQNSPVQLHCIKILNSSNHTHRRQMGKACSTPFSSICRNRNFRKMVCQYRRPVRLTMTS
jgi:hypothetical protein